MYYSYIGDMEHGHGGRLIESVAAAYKRDGPADGKTLDDIYKEVWIRF